MVFFIQCIVLRILYLCSKKHPITYYQLLMSKKNHLLLSSKKKKMAKPASREVLKTPYVELEVNTWQKDSQGLFDYDQTQRSKFVSQHFKINRSCKIFRHVNSMKTRLQYDSQKRDPPMEYIYIASISIHPITGAFFIQSADVTGIQPHPYIRQQHPDIFRNSLLVVRGLKKSQGIEGYPLEAGKIIRLGRVDYQVIEIMDGSGLTVMKQTSHLQLNKDIYKIKQTLTGSCRFCLCEQATQTDPLIAPCSCKGSCSLVHVGCLKNWINSKVKKDVNGIAISYNFSKFECEICKTLLPKAVQLKEGVQLITFAKPNKPYIIFESVTETHERRQQLKQRNLHVISPQQNSAIKLGRGHQCEIRMTDVSVSRVHAEIRYLNGRFYIKDLKSKFGTLVKFREELELRDTIRIQYGRTCFDFLLHQEEQTVEDQQESQKRPLYYTRSQQKERAQIQRANEG